MTKDLVWYNMSYMREKLLNLARQIIEYIRKGINLTEKQPMNAKLLIVGSACLFLLAGCGKLDRTVAHYRGWSEICIHGVQYLQFSSGASVEYTTDGHVKNCQ